MPVERIKYTPGKSIQVRIVSPTRVMGVHYEIGQLLELSEQHGLELIVAGKARQHIEIKVPEIEKPTK